MTTVWLWQKRRGLKTKSIYFAAWADEFSDGTRQATFIIFERTICDPVLKRTISRGRMQRRLRSTSPEVISSQPDENTFSESKNHCSIFTQNDGKFSENTWAMRKTWMWTIDFEHTSVAWGLGMRLLGTLNSSQMLVFLFLFVFVFFFFWGGGEHSQISWFNGFMVPNVLVLPACVLVAQAAVWNGCLVSPCIANTMRRTQQRLGLKRFYTNGKEKYSPCHAKRHWVAGLGFKSGEN